MIKDNNYKLYYELLSFNLKNNIDKRKWVKQDKIKQMYKGTIG